MVVSVVSGRDEDALPGFLESLWADAERLGDRLKCVAIANAASCALIDRIRSMKTDNPGRRLELVVNAERRGFAANHNRTMREHEADYYLIANDDVVVLPGTLDALIAYMEDPSNVRVAVASPKLLNVDRTPQGSTFSFPSFVRVLVSAADLRSISSVDRLIGVIARVFRAGRTSRWAHDRTVMVDSVRGAFMLVRRDAVDDAGLIDEVSAVGGEELEWHRRMASRGWLVAFVHDAAVVHVGGLTVGGDAMLRTEYVKGWLNYFQKHGRPIDLLLIRVGLLLIYGVRFLAYSLTRRPGARAAARAGLRVGASWPRIWRAAAKAGLVHHAREQPEAV